MYGYGYDVTTVKTRLYYKQNFVSMNCKEVLDQNKQINDPGSVQYGNFINYYQFNSAENRISLLPSFIWKQDSSENNDSNYVVLDIGCNSGNLTQILYSYLVTHTEKTVYILAIDIDPHLIERCNQHNQHKDNVTYDCLNIMECEHLDDYLKQFNRSKFDAIFSLSLTMWIHINNGDNGLDVFLRKISSLGNLLVLEPQPWKCYLTAVRRMRKSGKTFEKFKDLKLRNNVESWIQETILGKGSFTLIFETIPTKWNRKISFYKIIKKT